MNKIWTDAARDLLGEFGVPDGLIEKYAGHFARQLHDTVEEWPADIAEKERDAEEAAKDAYWHRKIDEARGK